MPIVVRPAEGDALTQGDVLQGLSFAMTSTDNKFAVYPKAQFLLVVSRPCKALRDEYVIVAPVVATKIDLGRLRQQLEGKDETATLDRMRRFLAGVRDGTQSPDQFYLGNLEEKSNKRFVADLSMFSTLQVPSESAARVEWVKKHRAWRLDIEFARDLHVRIFNGVARLGFDDYAWFADPDLDIMITEGDKMVAQCKSALAEAQGAVQTKEAAGETVPKGLIERVEKKQGELQKAEQQLALYVAEREKRQRSA